MIDLSWVMEKGNPDHDYELPSSFAEGWYPPAIRPPGTESSPSSTAGSTAPNQSHCPTANPIDNPLGSSSAPAHLGSAASSTGAALPVLGSVSSIPVPSTNPNPAPPAAHAHYPSDGNNPVSTGKAVSFTIYEYVLN